MTLKELRKSKRITQVDAAKVCDVSLRTYKRLEKKDRYVDSLKYQKCISILSNLKKNSVPNKNKYNIAVIGAGYVGLSIGVLLSEYHNVALVDINEEKVNLINNKISPIKDDDIDYYLKNKKLNLFAVSSTSYKDKDYIIIALPTDYDEKNKTYKTSSIKEVIKDIRKENKKALIIIKSTVMVGFTRSLNDNNIIFCPEFLKEGTALHDSLFPSRIIVGVKDNNPSINRFIEMLRSSIKNTAPSIIMSYEEAEATKLISNTYLAMRVSFFNEIDSYLEDNGLDANKVITGVSLDPRIGEFYNNPSFGYGGYCLPKDTMVMANQISKNGNHELITSIDKSNVSRKKHIANRIISFAKEISHKDKNINIGVYSINAKLGSDNTRNAAIIDVIKILKDEGMNIIYNDKSLPFDDFINQSDVIITNRYNKQLDNVKYKVYTRDIFGKN